MPLTSPLSTLTLVPEPEVEKAMLKPMTEAVATRLAEDRPPRTSGTTLTASSFDFQATSSSYSAEALADEVTRAFDLPSASDLVASQPIRTGALSP